MKKKIKEKRTLKNYDELAVELGNAANVLELAVTFLHFHGRQSAQIQNCIRLVESNASRARKAWIKLSVED